MFPNPLTPFSWIQPSQTTLRLNSRLCELSLDNFQVDWLRPSREVAKAFEQNPTYPGVILTRQGEFMGMISRQRFWELMGRPYSLELFHKRPLRSLYEFAQKDILCLSGEISVVEAARRSLERPLEVLTEPLVVQLDSQNYRLLDIHQLLVAQSHIHQLATQLLQESSEKLAQANQELERLATLDGLTEIANRRHFDNYLRSQWYQLGRSHLPLALLLADVDFFKTYNDEYGHLAGDDCLRKVAQTLHHLIQQPTGLVARYGGEEFAIVLPNCEGNAVWQIAQHLQRKIHQLAIPHKRSTVSSCVTLSLGGASMIPNPNENPQRLIHATDMALYRAKQQGRDRCVFEQLYQ